tara:strand:+ start:1979 stop:2410 length:432 start_codon:yes stop_codon:yes gene_type:complete
MGKGKKHESAAQERKNLLGINPIPDHASGSWMSKHSITSRGSTSPLHSNHDDHKPGSGYWSKGSFGDTYLGPMLGGTADYSGGLRSSSQGGRSQIAPTSQGGSAGFAGDTYGSDIKKSMNWFKNKLGSNKSKNTPKKNRNIGG